MVRRKKTRYVICNNVTGEYYTGNWNYTIIKPMCSMIKNGAVPGSLMCPRFGSVAKQYKTYLIPRLVIAVIKSDKNFMLMNLQCKKINI